MSSQLKPILCIPETIREDTLNYRSQVEKFLKGETSPISFKAYRVPMGVYEQRTTDKFMIRVRIGGGLILPSQLQRLAELSKKNGSGVLHVTTRQDIQIHAVNIEDTPDVLEGLLDAGLSSRGGGGNTVRNITACPEAGVCPSEVFHRKPPARSVIIHVVENCNKAVSDLPMFKGDSPLHLKTPSLAFAGTLKLPCFQKYGFPITPLLGPGELSHNFPSHKSFLRTER